MDDTIEKQLDEFKGQQRFSPEDVVGTGGTAIYGGYIQSLEKESTLQGLEKYKTFSELMANVAIVGAGVRYFLNLMAKVSWKAVPADDSAQAQELADKVELILHDMETPWARVVRRSAMYRFYGFSVQEWIAERGEDGVIGFKDIEPRPQPTIERWDTDDNGGVIGIIQRSPQTQAYHYLPREKVIYLVDDSLSDSPEGFGLFRHIAPIANRFLRYEVLEGHAFETDLRGIPVLRAPLAALQTMVKEGKLSDTKKTEMLQGLKDFIANHQRGPKTGLMLDSIPYQTQDEKGAPSTTYQWNAELMKGESAAFPDLAKAIQRKVHEMARLMGVEHLLLGAENRGSFALSRDKTNNFFLVIDSTLNELQEQYEKDIIGPLWLLNGWPEELRPQLKPEPVKFKDVEQLATVIESLATAGAPITPSDPVVNEFRDLLGVSRVEEEDLADVSLMPNEEPGMPVPPTEEGGEEDGGVRNSSTG